MGAVSVKWKGTRYSDFPLPHYAEWGTVLVSENLFINPLSDKATSLICPSLLCLNSLLLLLTDLSHMIEATGNGNSQCNLKWACLWNSLKREGRPSGRKKGRDREKMRWGMIRWSCEDSWLNKNKPHRGMNYWVIVMIFFCKYTFMKHKVYVL